MLSKITSKFKSKSNWAKKGALTVEYIVVFSALIATTIVFFRPGGTFHWAWHYSASSTAFGMEDMGQRLRVSRDGGGAGLLTAGARRWTPPPIGGGISGPGDNGNGDNTGQPGGSGPNTPN